MTKKTMTALVAALALVTATAALAATGTMVGLHKTTLGKALAGPQGRTLYLFAADKHGKSACYGQCAAVWPPLMTTARPRAATGVKASLLGMVKRKDGHWQVTYAGHPLYYFAKDKKPGQASGEGINHFGGSWYAVAASGKKIDHDSSDDSGSAPPTTTTTPTTTGGGYGSGYGYGG